MFDTEKVILKGCEFLQIGTAWSGVSTSANIDFEKVGKVAHPSLSVYKLLMFSNIGGCP